MSNLESLGNDVGHILRNSRFWVAIAIILGLVTGNFAFAAISAKPEIGLMKVNSELFPYTIPDIIKMIDYAENTPSIKAVVVQLDCPGGESVSTEELYLRLTSLRSKKPIVTFIDTVGASGGYYISVASNFIIAKPSSTVGSVGAYTTLPSVEDIDEDVIWTGPYKTTGGSRKAAMDQLETLKNVFLKTVVTERGDRLKITREEISKAGIYSGLEALKYGLVDQIGSGEDAFIKAANLAGVRNYRVVDIAKKLELILRPWWYSYTGLTSLTDTDNMTLEKSGAPVFYYRYQPPELQR